MRKRWTIRTQIMLALVILTLAATSTISFTAWNICVKQMEENYRGVYRSNLQAFDGVLEDRLQNMNDMIRSIFLSEEFLEVLKTPNETNTRYYSSKNSLILQKLCRRFEEQNDLVKSVAVFDEQNRYYIRNKTNQNVSEYLEYYKEKGYREEKWYDQALAGEGKEMYFGENVLWDSNNENTVSLVKIIKDLQTRETLGLIVVLLNKSFLNTRLVGSGSDYESDTLIIVDEKINSPMIYHSNTREYAETTLESYRTGNIGNHFLFTECKNAITGWKIINGIRRTELSKSSIYLRIVVAATTIVIVFFGILLSLVLSYQIYKPLHKLDRAVRGIKSGSTGITEEFDNSEIGEIGSLLKETINHNVELNEHVLALKLKERESELQLLQAQINPHFLYNTLDSVYCKAEIENQMEIARMIGALSDIFKISLSRGNSNIQIREELQYIEKYMQIQNIRYENRFELIMEVEEDIMELHMIKLILQPFVENAMYHGLEPKMGKGYIEIKGERIENEIYFTITDDGVGMEDTSVIFNGYGVRNVVDRIHLFYGEEYGITVSSSQEEGTRIQIRIPVFAEEITDGQ